MRKRSALWLCDQNFAVPYALSTGEAGSAELMSSSVPLFPDDFGIVRADLAYAESETQRREQRRHFD
jgi:hypothetical protein